MLTPFLHRLIQQPARYVRALVAGLKAYHETRRERHDCSTRPSENPGWYAAVTIAVAERRLALKVRGAIAILSLFTAAAIAVYSTLIATHWLRVSRLQIGLPALPEEWRGLRIALLTDFHAGGRRVSLDMLYRAKQLALLNNPDLVVLGGDYFDEGAYRPIGGLYTDWPPELPVVAVIGNHDYRGEPGELPCFLEDLDQAGVRVLRNESVGVDLRGRWAWIAGVDDPHTRRDDVDQALSGVPDGEPALALIAHSPTSVVNLPVAGARLMLAGHTHGGQVRLQPSGRIPFVNQVRRLKGLRPQPPLPYIRGWHWHTGTVVVISDGLGQSTIGARFRTRPEVVLIELADARATGPACDDVRRYVTYLGREPGWLRWLT